MKANSRAPRAHATYRGRLVSLGLGGMMALGVFAGGGPVSVAAAEPAWTAYVANQDANTVTPIDAATNTSGTPITVGSTPEGVAVTPDGATAYVANWGTDTVTPIVTEWNIVGRAILVGSAPIAIAITPDGRTAYVANQLSNTVTPINVATNTTGPSIPVGASPFGIAITPNGKTAYVANFGADTVTPINIATGTTGAAIAAGTEPFGMAVTPDGATVYVSNYLSNNVTPIDTATNTAMTPIPVGNHPVSIAITPDGATAYVVNSADATLTPITIATNTTATPISVPGAEGQVTITPDGATAYVPTRTNAVTPIDIATNALGTPINVGSGPGGMAITPDQAPRASLTVIGSSLGSATTFDASASTVTYGNIASYAWNFGDGATATTTAPTTTHTYAATGTYTATVTETSTAGTSTTTVFTGETVSRNGGASARASQAITVVAPGAYSALTPFRICDTRSILPANQCMGHTLAPAGSINVQVTGTTGPLGQSVPANALAVVLNVTAVSDSTVNSYVSVFPAGEALPRISNVSFDAGVAQANLVVVRVGVGGKTTVYNAAGRADVVVDVEGYFAPPGGAPVPGKYHSMPPLRICDTRARKGTECAGSFDNPLPANSWRDVVLSGLPAGATFNTASIPLHSAAAAVFDLTATQGTLATYLAVASPNMTTDACPTARPAISNLNVRAGVALPNRVISSLGPHQDVCIYNAAGSIDFIIDVNGWFGDGTESTPPPGALYYSIPPVRICDTRPTRNGSLANCQNQGIGPRSITGIQVAGKSVIPVEAGPNPPVAVVGNLTGVAGTASTAFTLFPAEGPIPVASDLNPRAGDVVANLAFVAIATSGLGSGEIDLYNAAGDINAIFDAAGWFQ